jgi:hypothetical protein
MRRDWPIRQFDLHGRFGAFFPGEGHAHCFDFSFSRRSLGIRQKVQAQVLILGAPLLWSEPPLIDTLSPTFFNGEMTAKSVRFNIRRTKPANPLPPPKSTVENINLGFLLFLFLARREK